MSHESRGSNMLILGVDPGYGTLGFGFVRRDGAGGVTPVKYGVVRTMPGKPLQERLLSIEADFNELFSRFKPDILAIEELFFNKNITTGIQVAHARGVVLLSAAHYNIPVCEYNPAQVKMTVTGYGKATKKQVAVMTQKLLNLPEPPRPDDAADALAVAYCHANMAPMLAALSRINSNTM
jgi:crossover junction endodeoxyribonuclease RuvC